MSWYKAGKIAVANGSRIITGTGTDFVNNVKSGFALLGPDLQLYEIDAVTSMTSATLATPYRGADVSSAEYGILQTQGVIAQLSVQVADLIATFGPLRTALPDMILYVQQCLDLKNTVVASADRAAASEAAARTSSASALDSKNSSSQSAADASQQATNARTQATSAAQSAANAASSAAAAAATAATMGFGQNVATTAGLTYGYFGGNVRQDNSVVVAPGGTIALPPSALSYISVKSDGVVVRSADNFAPGAVPIAKISTDAAKITSIVDARSTAVIAPIASAGNTNRIINGKMRVDQEFNFTDRAIKPSAYLADMFSATLQTGSNHRGGNSSVSPPGYRNSIFVLIGNGAIPTGVVNNLISYTIEGYDFVDSLWGTADAKPITIGFWVYSDIPGKYSFAVANSYISGQIPRRSFVANYTINAAKTFEYKTITIPGDTAFVINNGSLPALSIYWDLGNDSVGNTTTPSVWQSGIFLRTADSVSLVQNSGAYFRLTGVSMNYGTTLAPASSRTIAQEVDQCKRYYQLMNVGYTGPISQGSYAGLQYQMPVTMRATPTISNYLDLFNASFLAGLPVIDVVFNGGFRAVKVAQATGVGGWANTIALDARI